MSCPQCGSNQSDELKFCKSCGANLFAVREVVATRDTDRKFDWSKIWVAEMMLSESERKKRKEELERQRWITPVRFKSTLGTMVGGKDTNADKQSLSPSIVGVASFYLD